MPIASAELGASPKQLDRLRIVAMAKAEQIEKDVNAWIYIISVIRTVMAEASPTDEAA